MAAACQSFDTRQRFLISRTESFHAVLVESWKKGSRERSSVSVAIMKICLRISGRATVAPAKARVEVGRTAIVFALARTPVVEDDAVGGGATVAGADMRTIELLGTPEDNRLSTGVCRGVGGS
jgi:hypothetical protein